MSVKDIDRGYGRVIAALGPLGSVRIGIQGAKASAQTKSAQAHEKAADKAVKKAHRVENRAEPKPPKPPKPNKKGVVTAKQLAAYDDRLLRWNKRVLSHRAGVSLHRGIADLLESRAVDRSITVGEIAEIHEFGLGVPERSWLRSWCDAKQEMIARDAADALRQVILGKLTRDRALGILCVKWVGDLQEWFSSGNIQPPLNDDTIKRKGSSTPLIDTGQLRSAITAIAEKTVSLTSSLLD